MRKPKSAPLGGATTARDPDDTCAPDQRDRHGFRGRPPPLTNFSLSALADDALLNENETAAVLRLSTNTLGGWRRQPDHSLKWLALPNGYVRYTVGAIRAFLAMGTPRKPKLKDDTAPSDKAAAPSRKSRDRRSRAARRSSRRRTDDQPEAATVP